MEAYGSLRPEGFTVRSTATGLLTARKRASHPVLPTKYFVIAADASGWEQTVDSACTIPKRMWTHHRPIGEISRRGRRLRRMATCECLCAAWTNGRRPLPTV